MSENILETLYHKVLDEVDLMINRKLKRECRSMLLEVIMELPTERPESHFSETLVDYYVARLNPSSYSSIERTKRPYKLLRNKDGKFSSVEENKAYMEAIKSLEVDEFPYSMDGRLKRSTIKKMKNFTVAERLIVIHFMAKKNIRDAVNWKEPIGRFDIEH